MQQVEKDFKDQQVDNRRIHLIDCDQLRRNSKTIRITWIISQISPSCLLLFLCLTLCLTLCLNLICLLLISLVLIGIPSSLQLMLDRFQKDRHHQRRILFLRTLAWFGSWDRAFAKYDQIKVLWSQLSESFVNLLALIDLTQLKSKLLQILHQQSQLVVLSKSNQSPFWFRLWLISQDWHLRLVKLTLSSDCVLNNFLNCMYISDHFGMCHILPIFHTENILTRGYQKSSNPPSKSNSNSKESQDEDLISKGNCYKSICNFVEEGNIVCHPLSVSLKIFDKKVTSVGSICSSDRQLVFLFIENSIPTPPNKESKHSKNSKNAHKRMSGFVLCSHISLPSMNLFNVLLHIFDLRSNIGTLRAKELASPSVLVQDSTHN